MLTAVIDPERCVGCNICVQVCPFDAIVGANGQMHTVLLEGCVGCSKCVAPCPVECISMVMPPAELLEKQSQILTTAKQRRVAKTNRRITKQVTIKLSDPENIIKELDNLIANKFKQDPGARG